MDTEKLIKKNNKKTKTTYSMQFRFLMTVIFAMLAITIFIGGLSLYEVDNYIQGQSEEFVRVTGANEAAQINGSLGNMEKSVKVMESYLMDFFTSEEDIVDPEVQKKVIKSAEEMFADVIKHTSTGGAIAYYFRFDPAISDSKTGLFYSKVSGGSEFIRFEPTDILLYDKDDTEHVGWFWQPYEAGEPIWMKPYHNQNNDILMISYVVPMYYGEKFIGVVGMDFDYKFLAEQVHSIKVYENGFAHLEIDGEVIYNDEHEYDEKEILNSKKYLHVSEKLVNGMNLLLFASYDDIRHIRYEIGFKILFVVMILSALFMIIAVFVVKRIVAPLKKLTEASVKLSNGDYDVEIEDSDTYEIKLLSIAFENMAKRLREREERLHLSANRDSLTGLRNTTAYTACVAEFDKEIKSKGADFGVLVLDINYLKETNDKYGHDAGNKLIVAAAQIISGIFKRSPVFRVGGDEFVVILQNRDLEDYEELCEKLDTECENESIVTEGGEVSIGLARGFARYKPEEDTQFLDVFNCADNAMYRHKRKMKSVQE